MSTKSIAALSIVSVAILACGVSAVQARPMRVGAMSHAGAGNCALCHQQTTPAPTPQINTPPVQANTKMPAMPRQRPSLVRRMRVMPSVAQPMVPAMPGGIAIGPAMISGSGPGDTPAAANRADPQLPVLPPEVKRSQDNPPVTEINSAKALNDLLVYLATQPADNRDGTPVELDASILPFINVTAARSGAGFGVLKNGGRLNWPPALQDLTPEREAQQLRNQVASQVQDAIAQAREGRVDEPMLAQLRSDLDRLRGSLKRNIQRFAPSPYLEAKRFVNDLEDAVKVLREPDIAQYLNGRYTAQGRTVGELIKYLADNRLRFAPAAAGDEAAYARLRQALVAACKPTQTQTASAR